MNRRGSKPSQPLRLQLQLQRLTAAQLRSAPLRFFLSLSLSFSSFSSFFFFSICRGNSFENKGRYNGHRDRHTDISGTGHRSASRAQETNNLRSCCWFGVLVWGRDDVMNDEDNEDSWWININAYSFSHCTVCACVYTFNLVHFLISFRYNG